MRGSTASSRAGIAGYAVAGESAEASARELPLRYGHFPYLTSKSGAMDDRARVYFATHAPAVPSSAAVP